MELKEERVDGEVKYSGVIVNVTLDHAKLINGDIVRREVVHHPGGVSVLPIDENGYGYMVRQYRYPMQREFLEIPAGKLDHPGEDPKEAVIRELSEETGFEAENWDYFGKAALSPGYSDEVIYIYIATGLKQGDSHPDDDEFLNVEKYPLKELHDMVLSGQITDAKSIIAILVASEKYL